MKSQQKLLSTNAVRWLLMAIFAIAAALRLYGLNRQGLWFDEAVVATVAQLHTSEVIPYIRVLEKTPPLYYFIIHFWVKVFPNTEWWIRLPSVIAGVAAVWLSFVLVTRLTRDSTAGLATALLLAVNPYHIHHSQDARAYALMVLLALWSTLLLVGVIENASIDRVLGYVLIATALLYTHLYGATVVAGHVLTVILALALRQFSAGVRARVWTRMLWMFGLVGILYAPWVPTVLRWSRGAQSAFWITTVTPGTVLLTYIEYSGSIAGFIALLLLMLFAVGRRASLLAKLVLVPLLLMPVIPAYLISLISHPIFIPRYGVAAVSAISALAAIGATRFGARGSCVVALGAAICVGAFVRYPIENSDWRGVGKFLASHMRRGDFAAVTNRNVTILYDYYVTNRPDIPMLGFDGAVIPIDPAEPRAHVWTVIDTTPTPEADIVAEGAWRVVSRKEFFGHGRPLVVLELEKARKG